jgi:hypothetical protein
MGWNPLWAAVNMWIVEEVKLHNVRLKQGWEPVV